MERIKTAATLLAWAAVVVTPVWAFIVGMAWLGGYPGFGQWWLVNVATPTWVSMVVLVAAFWAARSYAKSKNQQRA